VYVAFGLLTPVRSALKSKSGPFFRLVERAVYPALGTVSTRNLSLLDLANPSVNPLFDGTVSLHQARWIGTMPTYPVPRPFDSVISASHLSLLSVMTSTRLARNASLALVPTPTEHCVYNLESGCKLGTSEVARVVVLTSPVSVGFRVRLRALRHLEFCLYRAHLSLFCAQPEGDAVAADDVTAPYGLIVSESSDAALCAGDRVVAVNGVKLLLHAASSASFQHSASSAAALLASASAEQPCTLSLCRTKARMLHPSQCLDAVKRALAYGMPSTRKAPDGLFWSTISLYINYRPLGIVFNVRVACPVCESVGSLLLLAFTARVYCSCSFYFQETEVFSLHEGSVGAAVLRAGDRLFAINGSRVSHVAPAKLERVRRRCRHANAAVWRLT
jgi:hypothetical protein